MTEELRHIQVLCSSEIVAEISPVASPVAEKMRAEYCLRSDQRVASRSLLAAIQPCTYLSFQTQFGESVVMSQEALRSGAARIDIARLAQPERI